MQGGGDFGFGMAQAGQLGGGIGLFGRGMGGIARQLRDQRFGFRVAHARGIQRRAGVAPAAVQQHGLGLADMVAQVPVAVGLAGLLLQRFELAVERDQHVFQPLQIGFSRAQAQLGLVPAVVQAGDAGGFFEQRAAVGRTGGDQRADAALADDGGRTRAAGGVGEQKRHVARAHIAAVDLVERAFAALDAPGDFQRVGVVERGGCRAVGIVQYQRHFRDVAGGLLRRAAEDDVVHFGTAHFLGRGFGHHPAQGVDEIRFAAAVRPDHAGHAGFDRELGGIDEGFEAGEAKFGKLDQGRGSERAISGGA